jgi:hypothetical protein
MYLKMLRMSQPWLISYLSLFKKKMCNVVLIECYNLDQNPLFFFARAGGGGDDGNSFVIGLILPKFLKCCEGNILHSLLLLSLSSLVHIGTVYSGCS